VAEFQLSVSKTFALDTDKWGQDERDQFLAALEKVGYKADDTSQPTNIQCEAAVRLLLEDENSDFWDDHLDLDEITPVDVKVVCFSRQFDRFKPDTEEEDDTDVKKTDGDKDVASKSSTSDTKGTTSKTTSPNPAKTSKPSSEPGPKVTSGSVIQGARDSKQLKK
jgi:hypothetical protein